MKTQFESVKLIDYEYSLPEERIAKYPLDNRSSSKLLVYRGGEIKHEKFKSIADYIYEETTIFFNNTKVIPARLHFRKDTGALIEIFLLEPLKPTNEVAQAMLVNGTCTWRCMVGNFKKWKNEQNLMLKINIGGSAIVVTASIKDRGEQIIQFSWQGNRPFV
ncbi:MAG: S-adenosylmethionine:tRNA ribosyltransferase-isomerase, partial [Bacteroidota bacterium]